MSDYEPNLIPPLDTRPPKKPSWLRRHGLVLGVGIGALVVGALVGSSAASGAPAVAEPAPTVTVTTEVPAVVEVDEACKAAAVELQSIAEATLDRVVIPQQEVLGILVSNLQYGINVDEINGATLTIGGASDAIEDLTARAAAITDEYQRCVNP